MKNEAKLGTIPTGNEGRDAVHVAIVPACAAETLGSGEPVNLNSDNKAKVCAVKDAIGVVDPFRPQKQHIVPKGTWFWLCLYPKTITGLRHVWEHPAFPVDEISIKTAHSDNESASLQASQKWIENYVRKHCPYWAGQPDGGYSDFIYYVEFDHQIFFHGTDCYSIEDVDDADELFHHLSVVLDKKIDAYWFDKEDGGFTCSC